MTGQSSFGVLNKEFTFYLNLATSVSRSMDANWNHYDT